MFVKKYEMLKNTQQSVVKIERERCDIFKIYNPPKIIHWSINGLVQIYTQYHYIMQMLPYNLNQQKYINFIMKKNKLSKRHG